MSLLRPVARASRVRRLLRCTGPGAGLLCVLLTGFAGLPAHAQWKWRDAQGAVQYSDRPPPAHVAPRDILQRPASPARGAATLAAEPAPGARSAAPAASGPRTVDPELGARRREAEEAERKLAEEKLARERADSCARARDYQRTLESGTPIARVNAQGERLVLGENERRAEMARAREIIAADCR